MDSIRACRINKHKTVLNLIRVQGIMRDQLNEGSNGSYPVRQVTYGISHASYQERHKGSGDIPLDPVVSSWISVLAHVPLDTTGGSEKEIPLDLSRSRHDRPTQRIIYKVPSRSALGSLLFRRRISFSSLWSRSFTFFPTPSSPLSLWFPLLSSLF